MNTKRSPVRPAAALLLAALLLGIPGRAEPAGRGRDTVLILHTNDIHSHLLPGSDDRGGMARIGGYVAAARAERKDVLVLDAGDGVTGTPVSSIFGGRPVFHVMNAIGYDAAAIGNHEFDHGFQAIAGYRRIAAFPLLSTNVRGPDGELLADDAWRVFEVDGVRVGVIGLTTDGTPWLTAPGATEGCTFEPPDAALRALLPEVRKRSDLVVVLSHLGRDEDVALAKRVRGIDVIVGGHSHTTLPHPIRERGVVIVQAGCYGRFVGRLELTVDLDAGKVLESDGRLIRVTDRLAPSAGAGAAVEAWEEQVRERVDVTIGRTERAYSAEDLHPLLERIFRDSLGADLGFHNAGGIRDGLVAGDITIREVWSILPFENDLVTIRVKGSKLPGWARDRLGRVDPNRVYAIGTNEFAAAHASRYFPEGVEGVEDSGRPMRETVIEWIREHGGIE